jgi:hypothetical protein
MSRENGGVFGKPVSPDAATATGFWSLNAIQREKIATTWPADLNITPALKLDFNETTTLDNRISFTRATNGTYFNSSGVLTTAGSGVPRFDHSLDNGTWVNKGLLIEEARTNLALRSEEIENAAWTKVNLSTTTNAITSPDGTTTAERILETTTTGLHQWYNASSYSLNMISTNYSASIFVKGGLGRSWFAYQVLQAGTNNSFGVNFDLVSGFTSTASGGTGVLTGYSLKDVGNGWYKATISGRTGANGSHLLIFYLLNDTPTATYAGDTSKGYYVWGAQLEAGAFPTSYIATTSASVTRNADVASMTSTNFSSWYNATEGTTFWQGDLIGVGGGRVAVSYSITDNTTSERIWGAVINASDLISAFVVTDNSVDVGVINSPEPRITAVTNQTYKTASAYKLNDLAHTLDGRTSGTDTSSTIPTVNRLDLGYLAAVANTELNGHIAKFYYWNTRLSNNFLRDYTKT